MIKTLKSVLRPIFGNNYYKSSKTYHVTFQAQVNNKSKTNKKVELVLPLPLSNEYQQVPNTPLITPKTQVLSENIYDNSYAYWNTNLKPGKNIFEISFEIKVSPRVADTSTDFPHSAYSKLDRGLFKKYTTPNKYLVINDEIEEIATNAIGNKENVLETIEALNNFVINKLKYGKPIEGLYKASDALESDLTDCGGYDTLLGSLLLVHSIPVRLVSGFWAGYDNNGMHAWLEAMLPNGVWLALDPSMENLKKVGRSNKSGEFGKVGSDRIAFSVGCDFEIKTGPTDILQNPIVKPNKDIEVKTSFITQNG